MGTQTKIDAIAVQEVDPSEEHGIPDSNGIISSKTYKYGEIPEEDLDWLFEQNPGFVMEIRPDYVQRKHPENVQ